MHRGLRFLTLCGIAAVWLAISFSRRQSCLADESAAPPHWIWCSDPNATAAISTEKNRCRFERRFTIDVAP